MNKNKSEKLPISNSAVHSLKTPNQGLLTNPTKSDLAQSQTNFERDSASGLIQDVVH